MGGGGIFNNKLFFKIDRLLFPGNFSGGGGKGSDGGPESRNRGIPPVPTTLGKILVGGQQLSVRVNCL